MKTTQKARTQKKFIVLHAWIKSALALGYTGRPLLVVDCIKQGRFNLDTMPRS